MIAGGWAVLVVLHLWIARGVTGPIVLQDETGYLGNARWLAGLSPVPEMGDQPVYAWGYSLLIAPLSAAIDDPALLYRSVQVLNSVLLASLFPLLWLVLRRVGGVEPRIAVLAAGVGSVFPATLVHSSIAWSESLLPVLMVLLVLATWAALTERPTWQRVWPVPVALAAYAAHPRFLAAFVLTVLAVAAAGAAKRIPRVVATEGAATGIAGFALVRVVDRALLDARWPDRIEDEGSVVRLVGRLIDPTNWPGLVASSIGQAWYLAVASLGLAMVGVVAAVWWLRQQRPADDAGRLTVAFALLVIAALFVTSAVSFVGTAERVDHLIYGRYNEAWVPLMLAVGVVALIGEGSQRRLLAGSAAATVALGAVLFLGRGSAAFEGEVVWNNILGLRLVTDLVGQGWMVPAATLLAAVALVVPAVIPRRVLPIGWAATGLVLVAMGVAAVGPLADFAQVRYDGWRLPDHLERVADVAQTNAVGLERERSGLMATLGYPFWSSDLEFGFLDRWDASEPPGLVVSSVEDPDLDASGARLAVLDARNGQGVWVLPGSSSFDRLVASGAVLPQGFPSRLGPDARLAEITLVGGRARAEWDSETEGGRGVLEVERGESFGLTFEVRHEGTAEAWPSDVEWPMPGVVRLGFRWYDDAGNVVRSGDWAPLPDPMWPGDAARVHAQLDPIDAGGMSLSPGRYVLGVDLFQAEIGGWFAEEGAEALRIAVEIA